ncbi:hypothetical protein FNF28_01421 [Cafeteria roenbergensis]|uniref:Uncharacterized protein n=1 Tax=Cafeteria roenbergensis TaxID=33653 RepID=A0A5A8E0S7_CAFRO|nr:hypothetical protein FNF28_01421 [Cafeteria roenbergensis]
MSSFLGQSAAGQAPVSEAQFRKRQCPADSTGAAVRTFVVGQVVDTPMGRAVIESLPVGGQPQYRVRYQRGGFGSHVPDSIMARGGIELGRELKRAEMDAFCASRGDSASSLRIGARGWGAQHGTSTSAAWGSPVASTGAQWGGFSTHHGGAAPAGGSAHRSTATADEDDDLF